MIPNPATGTERDRNFKSFVESPTRGESGTAQEVFVGNAGDVNFNAFAPPSNANAFTRTVIGNTEVIEYRETSITGPIIKTVKVYYQQPPNPDLIGCEVL